MIWICLVHWLRDGVMVTKAGTEHGAPYCPLCLFPPVPPVTCEGDAE